MANDQDNDGVLKGLKAYAGFLKYSNVKYLLVSEEHNESLPVRGNKKEISEPEPNFQNNQATEKKSQKGWEPPRMMEKNAPKPDTVRESPELTSNEVLPSSLELFSLSDEAAGYTCLDDVKEDAMKCTKCVLANGRTHVVFGEGDPNAKLMFIGEGPGEQEDLKGRPFVGRAGQLLDKMIAAMGYKREEVFIANIVKCRPPQNRAPLPDEAVSCLPYLRAQISFVKPKIIVLLGAVAVKFLLQTNAGISQVRGKFLDYYGYTVMPTFHPAFLLRSPGKKKEAWEDLKKVMAYLKES